jgi:TatD DNase family protein
MIAEKERQSALFRSQIEFALKHNKALMIHSRSAYDDLITILGEYKKTNPELFGNVHFFSGNTEQAIALAGLGFTLSFAGPITFAREYDDAIRAIPSTMIHAETDSPYATPVPFRGKRNEPLYVSHIAKKLAEIRGEDEDVFKKTLVENAFRLFNIRL